ncbi:MAG: hypothetical protein ABJB12_19590 [Pseudomonadota bacterium]
MTVYRIALVVALSTGCASVGPGARGPHDEGHLAGPALSSPTVASNTATEGDAPRDAYSASTDARAGVVGHGTEALRHFYLLSPGPNATLVVTRSDLATH